MTTPTKWIENKQAAIQKCIPPLTPHLHKGSSGRIGILGGSAQYTGAPYYAAMSALKVGADLAFVFCAEEASIPIKCYSPELMVKSVYSTKEFDFSREEEKDGLINDMVSNVMDMMPRLHTLIIGPGLGRHPMVLEATSKIIKLTSEYNVSLVLDADALYLISLPSYRPIIQHALTNKMNAIVLTPNVVEYKRLFDGNESLDYLDGTIIIQKGEFDTISYQHNQNDKKSMICAEQGGYKRSGGIGDVLAGVVGTLLAWNRILESKQDQEILLKNRILSCWTACCITKKSTNVAFRIKKRSMTAPDIINEIGNVFDDMVTDSNQSHL